MKIAKLVLWITALVLIAALGFSLIYVSVKGKGVSASQTNISSKQVRNTQQFTDGLPREGLFRYETKIKKAGTYRVTFDPVISPNTCVIGSEIYDSDGTLLGAVILYDGEESKNDYIFTEGTCSFVFRYLTTEQDFTDFVDEYDASFNASNINKAISKVDFASFDGNGKVTVKCKVSIGSGAGSSVNLVDTAVYTGISVMLLAVLIVLGALYKQKKPATPEVYDGTAPAVPEPPAKKPAKQPVPNGYAQPVYQQPAVFTWICPACGERSNKGRFCINCGQPHAVTVQQPAVYAAPVYQAPVYQPQTYQLPGPYQTTAYQAQPYQTQPYQAPSYVVPVQYQVPVTYQQPVQYVQPVFTPAPVQPVFAPVNAYNQVKMPDYRAKPQNQKPAHPPADPEFVNEMKERIPAIGARYAAFCVLFLLIQLVGALLLSILVPDVVRNYKTAITYGLVVLAVDAIGFPFIWLLMRSIPKMKIEQHKLTFSQWFGYLMMTEGLILIGSLAGSMIHSVLTQPFGGSTNATSSLMENSNVLLRCLVVGVGAPVFEELIFRKVLIDRTIKYGEYTSIVMSGIMFGLLHGNFQQFFFAALVGMLFAYVYIRTGRIRYSIYLHMAINLSSSLVVQTLLQKMLEGQPTVTDTRGYKGITLVYMMLLLMWIGGVFAIGIIGIVKLIKGLKRKRLALNISKGEPTHKEVRRILLKDKALWLYILMTILLFLHSYLPNVIVFLMDKAG